MHSTQTMATSLLWVVGWDEVNPSDLTVGMRRLHSCSPDPARRTQYLGRPAWNTAPPPCAARDKCPRRGKVRGWCRNGYVGSGRHRRRLSMGTKRSSKTRHPALQGMGCVKRGWGCRQGPRQASPSQARSLCPGHPTPTAHCEGLPPPLRGGRGNAGCREDPKTNSMSNQAPSLANALGKRKQQHRG